MNENTSNILVKIGLVLYICLCAVAIIAPCCDKCGKCNNCNENNQVQEQENTPTEMQIQALITSLTPAGNAEGQLIWLDLPEDGNTKDLANYKETSTVALPSEKLAQILDPKYYIDLSGIKNTGMYIPVAKVNYTTTDGKTVTIIYSTSNAQVDVQVDGEQQASGLLYNPDELMEVMQNA